MKKTMKCGLLGERLGHSYSKQIHACLADYEYELYGVPREKAAEMIKSGEFDGLNVTIPYKELAYSLCDWHDEFAADAKSVNTVVHRDGKICGYNTDVFGFMTMVERAGICFGGKNIVILGSGGTSKTAYLASKKMNAKKITVVSRSGEVNYDNVYSLSDTEIIVNTTPVGMYPKNGESPVDLARFPKLCGAVDVIYNPAQTEFIFQAEALSIPRVSGLSMLAAQAFRACEIFTGKSLSPDLVDTAVKDVMRSTSNIVLIGMPGSGKSTIAALLAEKTGRKLVDTDEEIRTRFGSPADIINTSGEDEFRKIETEVVCEFGRESGLIISTGGGVVVKDRNLPLLSQNGRIYLIERDLERLATDGRPLSIDVGKLYAERKNAYLRFADVKVDNNASPEEAAKQILKEFGFEI
ncbi:MAG: AAA family ATPase [Oscillospiraceae bacterium]|nr:AAA family ATPase [Oscillospiraceae bacterium]